MSETATPSRNPLKGKLNAPWTFSQGLLVLVAFGLSYTVLSWGHMYWVKTTIGFEAYLGDGPRLPPALLITNQIIKAITLFGAIWLLALKLRNLPWSVVGFRRCASHWVWAGIGLAVIGTAANFLLAKLLVTAVPDWTPFTASRFALGDGTALQITVLVGLTLIVTPFAEEIFFRGFLFQWIASRRSIWLAAVASSFMFGASHIIPPQAIVAFTMSLLILYLFLKSGSIWPCIVCHLTNNALGVAFGMAAVAGQLPAAMTPPV